MGNHTARPATGTYARRAATRAAKFIAPGQVAAWSAGYRYHAVGYHYGTRAHIDRLNREGIDVTRNRQGVFGAGFYMYSGQVVPEALGLYGRTAEGVVRVAVRMRNPAVFDMGTAEGKDAIHALMQQSKAGVDVAEFDRLTAQADALVQQSIAASRAGNANESMRLAIQSDDATKAAEQLATRRMTQTLIKQGYDGIVLRNMEPSWVGEGRDNIIAIKPSSVRVIR